ncbi:MAG TPA: hypothetical protein VKZ60_10310 [Chloroflexota bacterium]|nr:hypothetical protein [Chloroflexota bacterium]
MPVALAALVFAVYGPALGWAFLYDDGIDLARGETRGVVSLLTSAEGAYYYRPLPFLVWKGLHALLGRYDPFWFHLLPLLLHAANAWLVYAVGRGLGLPSGAALLAAGLFALTPFHYQAVPWAGALFHPLVTTLLLAALAAYWRARTGHGQRWLAASLAAATLALFTQEYAVTLGLLIAGAEWLLWRRRRVRAPRPYTLLYGALAAAFALWWLAVPKWPRPLLADPLAQAPNGLYLLQALLWPVALLWRWAPPALLAQPTVVVAAVGIPLVALGTGLYGRAGRGEWAVVALGWAAITALPVLATLPWEYLRDGPRLYYLPSVGIALGWAALGLLLPPTGGRRRVALAALALLYGAALGHSVAFLAERWRFYAEGSALLHEAVTLAQAAPPGARIVFVNLPAWRAPETPALPLGTTGVTYVPEYVLLAQALHVNGAPARPVESVACPDVLAGGWPLHYGPHGRRVGREELAALSAGAWAVYAVQYHPLRWERLAPAALGS